MHINGGTEAPDLPMPAHRPAERELASKTLAWLFFSGGLLALFTLALPHSAAVNDAGLVTLATAAFAVAAAMLLASPLGLPFLNLAAIVGTILITGALYFSEREIGAFAFFYLWIVLFAAYFLARGQAALQLAVIALAYGVLLLGAGNNDVDPVDAWVLTLGSLFVAGILVRILKERVDRLMATLSHAAELDHLTGLLNRRGFSRRLEEELERARRSERPLGLVIGDLDCFKDVNDRFGHEAGDRVLERVGAILSEADRAIDAVARIGGEEFALILPFTSRAGTHIAAERVRQRVRTAFAADELPLTISFGTATFPDDGDDVGALMKAADGALYTAKDLGRDRSCQPGDVNASQGRRHTPHHLVAGAAPSDRSPEHLGEPTQARSPSL